MFLWKHRGKIFVARIFWGYWLSGSWELYSVRCYLKMSLKWAEILFRRQGLSWTQWFSRHYCDIHHLQLHSVRETCYCDAFSKIRGSLLLTHWVILTLVKGFFVTLLLRFELSSFAIYVSNSEQLSPEHSTWLATPSPRPPEYQSFPTS